MRRLITAVDGAVAMRVQNSALEQSCGHRENVGGRETRRVEMSMTSLLPAAKPLTALELQPLRLTLRN